MNIIKLSAVGFLFFSAMHPCIQAGESYYPLEKGKTWVYKIVDLYETGQSSSAKVEVLQDTRVIDGKAYFEVKHSLMSGGSERPMMSIYMRTTADKRLVAKMKVDDEESLFMPSSLEEGKSWTAEVMGRVSTSTVVDTNATIETPDQTFSNCLVIHSDMQGSGVKNYFQQGVGLVAMVMVSDGEEQLMQYLMSAE